MIDNAVDAIPSVSVAVLDGDRVLLVLRGREPSRGLYAFPGGRVEPGETDEEAAAREVFEETGLTVSNLTEYQTVFISGMRDGVSVRYRLRVFETQTHAGTPVAGDDAEAFGWFGLADLDRLPMARSMAEATREILTRRY
ncbi:MAG TPA: NUDIX domain-containing protein [Rhizobiaceae bacterium]|nr:NUDIX domain-containing protein [Rhizobiaceae bacterium]